MNERVAAPPVFLNELGIVCALGSGRRSVAATLFAGTSGARTLADAAVDGTALPFAAVTEPLPETPPALARYASRNLALTLKALEELNDAVDAALRRYGPERIAVVMGSSTSGIGAGEEALASARRGSGRLPQAFDFQCQELGSVAESIAAHYCLDGPALTISTACTSSAKALATARRLLRNNLADAVIAGGCDSSARLTINGFHSLAALTRTRCLPFSANRDGTMIGEGAAVFLLSREPGGVLLSGVGESTDAHNMTAPDPTGTGAERAMRAALADACITAGDVAYVNLHGTATELNDTMESLALQSVFPGGVPSSSSKAQLGHTLGAAGAMEAAVCWLTLCSNPDRLLPPHVWDGIADPEAPLSQPVAPGTALPAARPLHLMSNSYAFGGSNASLIFSSCDD
jgi:3-oxoacyl-[acyl-carrier-protein] synthase-1